jgi:hypothetical protein
MYSKAWGWRLIVVLLAMAAPISGAEPASAEELVVDNANLSVQVSGPGSPRPYLLASRGQTTCIVQRRLARDGLLARSRR